jgi:NAD(P)-dependent dehydrogenase (short-subunit alcohol dehydrogenase family)
MISQKTYLIFGGVGGIGQAIAARLTGAGHHVFITSRDLEKAAAAAQAIGAHALAVDVLDADAIKEAVATAAAQGLNGIAYCVGSIDLKPMSRTTSTDLIKAFELNTVGAFLAVQAAVPALQETSGSVVLFSSIAAQRGFANHSAVGAAKGALESLARTLAAELAPKIRINTIAPSLTDTPLAKPFTENAKIAETIAAMHPIPRLGQAEDMAALSVFLLSDESGWTTGQTFPVDGGRSALEKK